MRIISTFVFAILTGAFIYLFNNPIPTGDRAIPPLGKVLTPFYGFWQNAESDRLTDISIHSDHVKEPVEIIFDDRLVPHIYAQNIEDALFAQGYLHAQFRLFQMDLTARSASGTLSEILGKSTIEKDRTKRRLGVPRGAKKTADAWANYPKMYQKLEHYIDGVNTFIESIDHEEYPIEYKLLNVSPQLWSDYHSALVQKEMCMTLCSYSKDIQNTNTRSALGNQMYQKLFPDYNPKESPIIPNEDLQARKVADQKNEVKAYHDMGYYSRPPLPEMPNGLGSNNWAVDKTKTASGNAILANDPHLSLTLPSIWYEIHINTPEMNVYGVSLPGAPGVIIGFNDHIAWGTTNVGHDITDWYKMDWTNDERTKYNFDGVEKEVEFVTETIEVKGQESIIETVKYTELGPSILFENTKTEEEELVYHWLANQNPDLPDLKSFLGMNMARNHAEFTEAISNHLFPAQNFIFADMSGEVGLNVTGKLQAKKPFDGKFIKEGNKKDTAWQQFIPRNELPSAHKPKRGYTSSANQRSTSLQYPYYMNGNFENYRGRRVNDLLDSMSDITAEDMKEMQKDAYNIKAAEALPKMLSFLDRKQLSKEEKAIAANLKNWDYTYTAESHNPTYFEEWYDNSYRATFDEIYSLRDSLTMNYPEDWRFVSFLEAPENDIIFDDISSIDKIETREDIVTSAFRNTVRSLQETTPELEWYKYNDKGIWHLLEIPAFSYEEIKAPGSGDVINAMNSTFGPSWRMVVELEKDNIKAFGVYPGGQSGNPGSQYYDNMIRSWSKGEHYSLNFESDIAQMRKKALFSQTIKN